MSHVLEKCTGIHQAEEGRKGISGTENNEGGNPSGLYRKVPVLPEVKGKCCWMWHGPHPAIQWRVTEGPR